MSIQDSTFVQAQKFYLQNVFLKKSKLKCFSVLNKVLLYTVGKFNLKQYIIFDLMFFV